MEIEDIEKPQTSFDEILRVELAQSLSKIEIAVQDLIESIKSDCELPCWVYDSKLSTSISGRHARDVACDIISAFDYEDNQDPHESITLPGVIGSSDNTLSLLDPLNAAKIQFKDIMLKMKGQTTIVDIFSAAGERKQKRVPMAKYSLDLLGRSRLHRYQTYRLLKAFNERPERIGFTWARTSKVEKISKTRAIRMLQALGDDEKVYYALKNLDNIPDSEPLVYVRPPHLHARANLVWPDQNDDRTEYPKQVNCSLPLFIPCRLSPRQTLPRGNQLKPIPSDSESKQRRKRINTKVDKKPFLPMINVFRYLPEYR